LLCRTPGLFLTLSPRRLQEIGYRIAAYPLSLLTSAVHAMQDALYKLAAGRTPQRRVDFAAIRKIVGLDEYEQTLDRYSEFQ
jgi:2-methylisocitrate lyase-like PEP mutase family enzyme